MCRSRNAPRILTRFCDEFEKRGAKIAEELTWQMGRPARYAPNEVRGTLERARHMIAIAPRRSADLDAGPKANFTRFVRREPLGVVFTIAAWNYPYLIAVNSVVPALMAGNAVILKHSAQTPLRAERFAECLEAAGLPQGRVPDRARLARGHGSHHPRPAHQLRRVHGLGRRRPCRAARGVVTRFIGVGLELGGCDPVYVRHDANLAHAIENIVDGAYFNSGQSCCGLQRIYVHHGIYQKFVDGFVELTRQYVLGRSPRCGHDARAAGAHRGGRGVRTQIEASIAGRRHRRDRRVGVRARANAARRISRRRCC